MNLPFFYIEHLDTGDIDLELDEDNSRHIVSVLRMQKNEQLHLTDGKGLLLTTVITDPHKKKCRVSITNRQKTMPPARKTGIGISLIKSQVRFEWFLEKATEIGIDYIVPLLCSRTEKQHFRYDRMKNILISALLQSGQTWMPVLQQPAEYATVLVQPLFEQKFIAHCLEEHKISVGSNTIKLSENQFILIGPEGDFTPGEIALALQHGYIAVTLGTTRLRTETAGITAAVLLKSSG